MGQDITNFITTTSTWFIAVRQIKVRFSYCRAWNPEKFTSYDKILRQRIFSQHSCISTWRKVFRITRHTTRSQKKQINRYPWPRTMRSKPILKMVSNLWSDGATTRIILTLVNLLPAGNRGATQSWESSALEKILNWMTLEFHLRTFYFVMAYRLSVYFCFYENSIGVKWKQCFVASCSD